MKKQALAQIIILALLVQSCVAYQNTSVSMNQAVDQGRVKVVSKEGNKQRLQEIIKKEDQFYGVLNRDITIPIDSASIEAVYKYDRGKSTGQTLGLIAGVTLGLGVLLGFSLVKALNNIDPHITLDKSPFDY